MSTALPIQVSTRRMAPVTLTAGQRQVFFTFPILRETDIRVRRTRAGIEAELAYGGDYTVWGAGEAAGGTVTLATGGLAGDVIVIEGDAALDRLTSVASNGRFSSTQLDEEFDLALIRDQELRRDVDELDEISGDLLAAPKAWLLGPADPHPADGGLAALYLNTASGDFFEKTAADTWTKRGNLRGPIGPAGPPNSAFDINFAPAGAGALTRTVQAKLREAVTVEDFGATGNGVTDDSAAFAAAFNAATYVLGTPGRIYAIKDLTIPENRVFDGRGCVLRDAPGAKWGVRLTGWSPWLINVTFQDQGNYVRATTASAAALANANTIQVASAAGIEAGQAIFIRMPSSIYRHYTLVQSVAGNVITLRDALPGNVSSGAEVVALFAAVWVGDAVHWLLDRIKVVNGRGCFMIKPTSTNAISNRGSMGVIDWEGARYFGYLKAENAAGVKARDIKGWCGWVDVVTLTANGTAGPYAVGAEVFLKRDVTVYVNNVLQAFPARWVFSGNSIQFTAGNIPISGATIRIEHFRDGYYGLIEDQRNTAVISGGSNYSQVEVLDAITGVYAPEGDLCDFDELIIDSISGTGLNMLSCSDSLNFGKTFIGFANRCIASFSSNAPSIGRLFTKRVPTSETVSGTVDDNVYVENSNLRINIDEWTGEDHQIAGPANGVVVFKGGREVTVHNRTNIPANTANALFESYGGDYVDAGHDGWVLGFNVAATNAPGAGQSFTYDLLVNNAVVATAVISGANFSATARVNAYIARGQGVSVRVTTSAAANGTAVHRGTIVMS
jgi:hypothetical protein